MFDIFSKPEPKAAKEEQGYVTVRMPIPLRDAFNALCAKHGVSSSEAVRRFMISALEQDASKTDAAK